MPQDLVGRSIAHYRITGQLGQGGMGEVYRATDPRLELRERARVRCAEFRDESVGSPR